MSGPYGDDRIDIESPGVRRCYGAAVAGTDRDRDPGLRDAIGVRELRNQVAAVVRRAGGGERIIVTVDGRPVAQLGPLEPEGPPTLADLAATGLVEAPRTQAAPAEPEAVDLAVDIRLDRLLEELRGR